MTDSWSQSEYEFINPTGVMSYRDKHILTKKISKLPSYELGEIARIVQTREPLLAGSDPDEVLFDLEVIKPQTLREIESFVLSYFYRNPRKVYKKKVSGKAKKKLMKKKHQVDESVGLGIQMFTIRNRKDVEYVKISSSSSSTSSTSSSSSSDSDSSSSS